MTRQQASKITAQERVDAAVVDAYERRVAAQREASGTADDDLDAELQAEIAAAELQAYVTLHQRVAGMAQTEVAASVRGVVLSAAAIGAEAHLARKGQERPLVRWLVTMMRPGPLMALATIAAICVALSVRYEAAPATAELPPELHADNAVAMVEAPRLPPATAAAAPVPAATVPASTVPAVPPDAPAAAPQDAPHPEPAAAAPVAAAISRPTRTIEAQAASLGPVAAASDAPTTREAAESPKREVQADAFRHASAKASGQANLGDALDAANDRRDEPMRNAAAQAYRAPAAAAQPSGYAANEQAAAAPVRAEAANEANAAPADEAAERRNVGTRNQVAEKAAQDQAAVTKPSQDNASGDSVAHWRQSVADAQTPEERIVALKQLVVAAQAAGDQKTAKAAQQALKTATAEQVARKRAQALQETPPAQRAKDAPSQSSGELKAQKR